MLQDARLNQVMKKLTGWAAIIAVPTAITGFYGQNVDYPGLETVGGFVTSSGADHCACAGAVLDVQAPRLAVAVKTPTTSWPDR